MRASRIVILETASLHRAAFFAALSIFAFSLTDTYFVQPVCAAPEKKQTPKSSNQRSERMLDGLLIKHYAWLSGDVDIAVTPKYLCISKPHSSAVTVSQAPFKTVVAYDTQKKTFYETKPEAAGSFLIQRFMKLLGADPHPQKWKKVEDSSIAGVKAGRYIVDHGDAPVDKRLPVTGEKVLTDMRISGFWAAENLPIDPNAADIVCKMEGFPSVHKFPLHFQLGSSKDKRPRVTTYSVTRAKFPFERFQVPGSYRKVGAEYSAESEELELFGAGDSQTLKKKLK